MSSLLTRTIDYEEPPTPEDFSRFHVRSGGVAGTYFTETRHPAGYRIPRHAHEMTSLYLVLQGSLTEQFGREDVERKTDELVFTPPDAPHSNVFLGRGGSCFIVEMNPAVISRGLECGKLPGNLKSFRGQAAWLARSLYREFCSSDAFSPLVIEGLILEIVGAICGQPAERSNRGPQQKISQARERLDASFSESISLSDVAQAVEVHPVYLARMFRQTYQCSVGEYLRLRRVGFACSALSASDKPLSEIASEAGFCDQAHFTRTFHRLTGLTPGQYRAACRR